MSFTAIRNLIPHRNKQIRYGLIFIQPFVKVTLSQNSIWPYRISTNLDSIKFQFDHRYEGIFDSLNNVEIIQNQRCTSTDDHTNINLNVWIKPLQSKTKCSRNNTWWCTYPQVSDFRLCFQNILKRTEEIWTINMARCNNQRINVGTWKKYSENFDRNLDSK